MYFGLPLALVPLGCFLRPGTSPAPVAGYVSYIPQNFGVLTPGTQSAEATSTDPLSATQIAKQNTVFVTVVTGGLAQLPADGSLVALTIFNRCGTGEALSIIPDNGGQIESLGENNAAAVADGGNATFLCFDPPLQVGRQWWII